MYNFLQKNYTMIKFTKVTLTLKLDGRIHVKKIYLHKNTHKKRNIH
jgi:hypothetical protein